MSNSKIFQELDNEEVKNVWCPNCQKGVIANYYSVEESQCCCQFLHSEEVGRFVLRCSKCTYCFEYGDNVRCKGCGVQIAKSLTFCPSCGYQTRDINFDLDVRRRE